MDGGQGLRQRDAFGTRSWGIFGSDLVLIIVYKLLMIFDEKPIHDLNF